MSMSVRTGSGVMLAGVSVFALMMLTSGAMAQDVGALPEEIVIGADDGTASDDGTLPDDGGISVVDPICTDTDCSNGDGGIVEVGIVEDVIVEDGGDVDYDDGQSGGEDGGEVIATDDGEVIIDDGNGDPEVMYNLEPGPDSQCGGCEYNMAGGPSPAIAPVRKHSVARSPAARNTCLTPELYVPWLCDWQKGLLGQ